MNKHPLPSYFVGSLVCQAFDKFGSMTWGWWLAVGHWGTNHLSLRYVRSWFVCIYIYIYMCNVNPRYDKAWFFELEATYAIVIIWYFFLWYPPQVNSHLLFFWIQGWHYTRGFLDTQVTFFQGWPRWMTKCSLGTRKNCTRNQRRKRKRRRLRGTDAETRDGRQSGSGSSG